MLDVILAIAALCQTNGMSIESTKQAQVQCQFFYAQCVGPLVRERKKDAIAERLRMCIGKRNIEIHK